MFLSSSCRMAAQAKEKLNYNKALQDAYNDLKTAFDKASECVNCDYNSTRLLFTGMPTKLVGHAQKFWTNHCKIENPGATKCSTIKSFSKDDSIDERWGNDKGEEWKTLDKLLEDAKKKASPMYIPLRRKLMKSGIKFTRDVLGIINFDSSDAMRGLVRSFAEERDKIMDAFSADLKPVMTLKELPPMSIEELLTKGDVFGLEVICERPNPKSPHLNTITTSQITQGVYNVLKLSKNQVMLLGVIVDEKNKTLWLPNIPSDFIEREITPTTENIEKTTVINLIKGIFEPDAGTTKASVAGLSGFVDLLCKRNAESNKSYTYNNLPEFKSKYNSLIRMYQVNKKTRKLVEGEKVSTIVQCELATNLLCVLWLYDMQIALKEQRGLPDVIGNGIVVKNNKALVDMLSKYRIVF